MKVTAFVSVNENTDLGVTDDDRLVAVSKSGNQESIQVLGKMSTYTFNGMRTALDRLETFIPK